MESVFPAAGNVPSMPPRFPRSLAALLVFVAVFAAGVGASGAGPADTAGPPTGTGDWSVDMGSVADGVAAGGSAVPGVTREASGAAATTHTPENRTREPVTVAMRVEIQSDGDARWEVSTTVGIDGEDDAAAFDALAAEFENGEVSLGFETFRLAVDNASAATGREMELRDVERNGSRTTSEGTLTLSFTWSSFARAEGDRLYVGDAFNTTDGTWLPRLTARETLVVVPPPEYGVVSAPQVGIVDGAARWEGPYSFDGREPWVVYSGEATSPATTAPRTTDPTTTAPPPTTTVPPDTPGGFSSILPVALLVVVAGASAALLAVYVRREEYLGGDGTPGDGNGTPGDGDATGAVGEATAETTAEGTDATADVDGVEDRAGEAATGPATAAGASGAGAEGTGEAETGTGEADDGIDEALLSDEERVERLLERNGGRMKQATIVKETGWSNAKVSQLLSAMADEDRIDKLRIGRENLISFPDEDVADIGSDDEE